MFVCCGIILSFTVNFVLISLGNKELTDDLAGFSGQRESWEEEGWSLRSPEKLSYMQSRQDTYMR